jgi:hypothetical protein
MACGKALRPKNVGFLRRRCAGFLHAGCEPAKELVRGFEGWQLLEHETEPTLKRAVLGRKPKAAELYAMLHGHV